VEETDIANSALLREQQSVATVLILSPHLGKAQERNGGQAFTSKRVSNIPEPHGVLWFLFPSSKGRIASVQRQRAIPELNSESCGLSCKRDDKVQLAVEF